MWIHWRTLGRGWDWCTAVSMDWFAGFRYCKWRSSGTIMGRLKRSVGEIRGTCHDIACTLSYGDGMR